MQPQAYIGKLCAVNMRLSKHYPKAIFLLVITTFAVGLVKIYGFNETAADARNERSLLNHPLYPGYIDTLGALDCGDFPCIGDFMCKSLLDNAVRLRDNSSFTKDGVWTVYDGYVYDKYFSRTKNASIHVIEEADGAFVQLNDSLNAWRRTLCLLLHRPSDCNLREEFAIIKTFNEVAPAKGVMKASLVRDLSPNLECATQRLVNRIVRRSASPRNGYVAMHHLKPSQKKSLLLKLIVAPHSCIKEAFPSNEKWPFGMSFGECGRIVVNKGEVGTPLTDLYYDTWKNRVDLAAQILDIVIHLTENQDGFFFVVKDLKASHFSKRINGKLTIVRFDDIRVIDTRVIDSKNARKDSAMKEELRMPKSCFVIDKAANIYAAFRILAGDQRKIGLLHHPEESSTINNQIESLLKQGLSSRKQSMDDIKGLQELLETIRPCADELPYRFPECQYDISQL